MQTVRTGPIGSIPGCGRDQHCQSQLRTLFPQTFQCRSKPCERYLCQVGIAREESRRGQSLPLTLKNILRTQSTHCLFFLCSQEEWDVVGKVDFNLADTFDSKSASSVAIFKLLDGEQAQVRAARVDIYLLLVALLVLLRRWAMQS